MSEIRRRARPVPASILLLSLTVGLGTYGTRVWMHHESAKGHGPAVVEKRIDGLPRPRRLSPHEAARQQLPHALEGYQLVSVVPEVKGHDLHALYESEHHISLFVRPIPAHPGAITVRDVGRYWLPTDPVKGKPAFARTDIHHRTALAWVARGNRHIVTGDVPLAQLRAFAGAYEEALQR